MRNYNTSVDIEPTDAYQKAKRDLVQALQSIQALTPVQQKLLAEEMLGAAQFASICQVLVTILGKA